MLKKYRDTFRGFVLLESLLALFVFSIITMSLIPLIVFMKEQKKEREFILEAGRFSHELIRQGGKTSGASKVSADFPLIGTTSLKDGVIYRVEISTENSTQQFAIYET